MPPVVANYVKLTAGDKLISIRKTQTIWGGKKEILASPNCFFQNLGQVRSGQSPRELVHKHEMAKMAMQNFFFASLIHDILKFHEVSLILFCAAFFRPTRRAAFLCMVNNDRNKA